MYGITGLGRFRVSVFRQRGWVGLVLRRVLPGIPGFEALTLPAAVRGLADRTDGLVLVTGLAGSGKTATLAAMVDHINTSRECHIVTIEDPIEVLHADKRSIVDQREVSTDTPTAHSALVHALRQDPDVIMVSHLFDADTAWGALQAAETGSPRARDTVDDECGRHGRPPRGDVRPAPATPGACAARHLVARHRLPATPATCARSRTGSRGRGADRELARRRAHPRPRAEPRARSRDGER